MLQPSLKTCETYQAKHTVIPVYLSVYADNITPILLLNLLKKGGRQCFLLESATGGEQWGRYSFIGVDPVKTIACKNNVLTDNGKTVQEEPVTYLRKCLGAYSAPSLPGLPPFTGGFVGYFGYESVAYFEKAIRFDGKDELALPDMELMLFENVICFDNLEQKIKIIMNIRTDHLAENYEYAYRECLRIASKIGKIEPLDNENTQTGPFTGNMTRDDYLQKVRRIQEYIKDGDIFQAVLAQRFDASFSGSFLNVYRTLRTKNPSPYMYYLHFGEIEIAGASPETLVKVEGGEIKTCPIAGTRPRGLNREEDRALAESLLADEKELSEHIMLVDLARNDVGKVARFGSVRVAESMTVVRYSHVMHLASLVTGTMAEGKDSLDVLEAVFPAGTLSGAPKIKAMQIIHEQEGEKRGVYGGAIGYIDFAGNMDMCIAIRTIVKKGGQVSIGAGAGIVYDSVPEKEYEETINKSAAVVQSLQQAGMDLFCL